jgi:hypothetical protein
MSLVRLVCAISLCVLVVTILASAENSYSHRDTAPSAANAPAAAPVATTPAWLPEPVSLTLLAAGGLTLFLRRRRQLARQKDDRQNRP